MSPALFQNIIIFLFNGDGASRLKSVQNTQRQHAGFSSSASKIQTLIDNTQCKNGHNKISNVSISFSVDYTLFTGMRTKRKPAVTTFEASHPFKYSTIS